MLDLAPHSGTTLFKGESIKNQRKNLSYVEQKSNIDTTFPIKVIDFVILGIFLKLKPLQRPDKLAKYKAEEALKKVNTHEHHDRQISELSGGQFQRILIARTIIQVSDLIFLDEPFVGIDITSENIIVNLLSEVASKGRKILVVHHDLSKVHKYFGGLILLNKSLISYGKVSDVYTGENIQKAFGTETLVSSEKGGTQHDTAIH